MRKPRTFLSGGIAALVLLSLVPGTAGAARTSASEAPVDPLTPLWQPISDTLAANKGARPQVDPDEFVAYVLDRDGIESRLGQAPAEQTAAAPLVVSLPDPTGGFSDFEVNETVIMEPRLAARHPEISTYAGRGVDNPRLSVRLDLTDLGLHASVRGPAGLGSWYIDPYYNGNDRVYVSYFGDDLPNPHGTFVESEENRGEAQVQRMLGSAAPDTGLRAGAEVKRRTYRLAFLTDPTYADYFGSADVLDAKVTLMNRVNQVYEDDLAIRMILINGTEKLNLDTAAKMTGSDGPCGEAACFTEAQATDGCTGGLLNRNRIAIGQLVGASAYDIGHIGLGLNGGGVAGLGVVGRDGKARGCTGLPFPTGDFYAVDYVAHEMGHQFSGNHTFNGTQGACDPVNRSFETSVEPGSGSSVMAYAGICAQDNLSEHSDPYFSQRSITEISDYVTAERSDIEEVQNVSLVDFDETDSFTLTYQGEETVAFQRGTTYNNALLTDEITRITGNELPVLVEGFAGNDLLADDTGFQVTFTEGFVNLAELQVTDTTGGVSAVVGETAQGGDSDNGGFRVQATGNRAPEVTPAGDHTIPIQTPFRLKGAATDADGDVLTYMWEQNDTGGPNGTSLVDNNKIDGPLFAQFGVQNRVTDEQSLMYNSPGQNEAGTSPTRVFPDMRQILANNTNAKDGTCPPAPPANGNASAPPEIVACYAEFLPRPQYVGSGFNSTPPSLNFRLTVRDTAPGAGGVGHADTMLTLENTAGPFLVTSQSDGTGAELQPGADLPVTWAVNGTDTNALAPNVRIRLSTDGGRTFPRVLAANTPNDGAHTVTVPKAGTDEARIMVEAVGNVFFDVNDADFSIANSGPVARDTSAITYRRVAVDIPLRAFDPDGDDLTYTATNGKHGWVRVDGGVATYRPRPRFVGTDSFRFRVTDGQLSDVATVEVAVKRRRAVRSTLNLSNDAGGNDRVKVTTSPAVSTTVRVFRINRAGDPVEVGSTTSSQDGVARLTVVDAMPDKPTTYVAKVARTASTRKSNTGRSTIQ